jgi:hypothetical protein
MAATKTASQVEERLPGEAVESKFEMEMAWAKEPVPARRWSSWVRALCREERILVVVSRRSRQADGRSGDVVCFNPPAAM